MKDYENRDNLLLVFNDERKLELVAPYNHQVLVMSRCYFHGVFRMSVHSLLHRYDVLRKDRVPRTLSHPTYRPEWIFDSFGKSAKLRSSAIAFFKAALR